MTEKQKQDLKNVSALIDEVTLRPVLFEQILNDIKQELNTFNPCTDNHDNLLTSDDTNHKSSHSIVLPYKKDGTLKTIAAILAQTSEEDDQNIVLSLSNISESQLNAIHVNSASSFCHRSIFYDSVLLCFLFSDGSSLNISLFNKDIIHDVLNH